MFSTFCLLRENRSAEFKPKMSPLYILKLWGEAGCPPSPQTLGGVTPHVCMGAGRATRPEQVRPPLTVRPSVPHQAQWVCDSSEPQQRTPLTDCPTLPTPCERSQDLLRAKDHCSGGGAGGGAGSPAVAVSYFNGHFLPEEFPWNLFSAQKRRCLTLYITWQRSMQSL